MLIFQTRTLCTILEVLYHFLAARLSLWIVYWTAAKTVIYWVAFHCGIQTRTVWSLYRCCCCLVTKSCPSLCNPMDCNTPAFLVLHYLLEFAQTYVWVKDVHWIKDVQWVNDAIQPSHPLSPSSPPALNLFLKSIRVFSNELALRIRWPKYWSFNFSISPSVDIQGWFLSGKEGRIFCPYCTNWKDLGKSEF